MACFLNSRSTVLQHLRNSVGWYFDRGQWDKWVWDGEEPGTWQDVGYGLRFHRVWATCMGQTARTVDSQWLWVHMFPVNMGPATLLATSAVSRLGWLSSSRDQRKSTYYPLFRAHSTYALVLCWTGTGEREGEEEKLKSLSIYPKGSALWYHKLAH